MVFLRYLLPFAADLIEVQVEAIAGVALCGICCVLMIVSNSFSCSKMDTTLAVTICSCIAGKAIRVFHRTEIGLIRTKWIDFHRP